jgi:Ca2+-binding EF-hand superfamily protein
VILLLDDGPVHLRLHVGVQGVSLAEARRQFVAGLLAKLDADKDGKLSREEANKSPLLRVKQRPRASGFLESLKSDTRMAASEVAKKIDALGGQPIGYRDELTSSKNDIEVFKLLDVDTSGSLDVKEIQEAANLILSRDEDGDQCVAFQEFIPPAPPPDPQQVALMAANPPIPPVATVSSLMRSATEALLPARLARKYNKRADQGLDASELGWSRDRISALDGDGNGLLDTNELKGLAAAIPDLEMRVDLLPAGAAGGTIKVEATLGKRLDDDSRPDYAKLALGGAVITFSHRNLDPFTSAIEAAMQQFNLLDADANGYLSKDETAERIRFERGLFDLIDLDGDEKVMADEMKEYVRARVEPAASTCRVNLYDTGNGFFMALDTNADGRVSVREVRRAAASLKQLDRDGQPGIGQTEPVRHFHLEFVRGSYQLFGPSEQLLAQTPAFQQRTPTGPIWFQRMDRNNDGDLTWNEFLGPRPIYHQLDADHDDLLDPQEAAKAQ